MKRINIIIMILVVSFFFVLEAQEVSETPLTVAVMDSQLGAGIPYNVSPITANYVSDTLLRLGKFNVIPRSEIYFGWVGAPSPEVDINHLLGRGDYAQLGRQIQADIICLLKVEKRDGSYRLTGEMIQAESGMILSTEISEASGILGLIDASKTMGEKLSGARLSEGEKKTPVLVPVAPVPSTAPIEEPPTTDTAVGVTPSEPSAPSKNQKPAASGKDKDSGPFSSLTIGLILPEFSGSAKSTFYNDFFMHNVAGSLSYINGGTLLYDLGANLNIRVAGDSFFCFDLGMNYNMQWIEYDTAYSTNQEGDNFSFIDFYLGPGLILPLGPYFQTALGVTLGYGVLDLSYSFWDDGTEIADGLTLGYNIGIEARTPGGFVLSLKYMAILASELNKKGLVDDDVVYSGDSDFGFNGIQIGIGTTL